MGEQSVAREIARVEALEGEIVTRPSDWACCKHCDHDPGYVHVYGCLVCDRK